jgi:hypothetical protein
VETERDVVNHTVPYGTDPLFDRLLVRPLPDQATII